MAQRLTRQAVGLARYLSDPLQEICNVAVSLDELMCIDMQKQQKRIDPYILVKHLQRELVDTVNALGCDVNDVVNHRFRQGQLQFVGGLGPRKAAALRQAILQKGGGSLRKREELITKNILGQLRSYSLIEVSAEKILPSVVCQDHGADPNHSLAEVRLLL